MNVFASTLLTTSARDCLPRYWKGFGPLNGVTFRVACGEVRQREGACVVKYLQNSFCFLLNPKAEYLAS